MTEPNHSMKRFRLVLLARDTDSTWMIYNHIHSSIPFETVIVERPVSRWTLLLNRAKRKGWWNALGQVLFIGIVMPLISRRSRKRQEDLLAQFQMKCQRPAEKEITGVPSVNSDACRRLLQELQPDLVIVNGTRIISDKTLQCIPAPFVNIHDGITPAYRGVHGGYWALANGQPELFGTTIHYVDKGVDTGGIIQQIFIQPDPSDNFTTYPILQHAVAIPELKEIVEQFARGEKPATRPPMCEKRPIHFHPTIWDWFRHRKRALGFLLMFESLAYLA